MRQIALAVLMLGLSPALLAQSSDGEAADAPPVLNLACDGEGVTNGNVSYNAHVYLKLEGANGRVQMPQRVVPRFSRSEDGWYDMHEIAVGPDAITAKVRFNALSTSRLTIDRVSGRVHIGGTGGSYHGTCQTYDPGNVQRAF